MPFFIPTTAQISNALERAARIAAPVIALLITATLLLAHLAYDLGFLLGSAIYERSAQLAALTHRQVLAPATPQPIPHPFAALATDLEQLTTRQLRQLTGIRRNLPKRQLIALALAC